MAIFGVNVPQIDFGIIGDLPQTYAQGQARAREDALRRELGLGLPRGPGGEIDYGAMAALMARHGNLQGVQQFAQLGEASQRAAQAAAHQRTMEGIAAGNLQVNQAQEARQAEAAGRPRTYRDINGEVIREHPNGLTEVYDPAQKRFVPMGPTATPPVDPNIWTSPQGRIPSGAPPMPGPQSSLSPSDEMIASAQTAVAGGPTAPMRGPQYAQAGGAPVPAPAPQPAPMPSWYPGFPAQDAHGRTVPDASLSLPPPPPGLTPLQQKQWSEEMVKQRAKAIAPEEQKALPVEMAARIGLAGKFLDEVPLIRERAAAGELSIGTGGSLQAYFNAYGPGELSRKIKSGTDALLRNLTGAGMPLEEAKKYVSRYEPQLLETSTSMLSKLDQLTDELRRIEENAYRGRGGLPQERIDARAAVAEAMAAIKQGRNKKMIMQRLKDTYGISFGDF
jgi:hypothetical protein